MSEASPNDGMCHETSGFLFSHPCDRFSTDDCLRCKKPLCDEHSHHIEEGVVCTTCLKKDARLLRQDRTVREYYHDHYYYDDPYFYSDRYYRGYGTPSSSRRISSPPPTAPGTGSGSFGDDSTNDPDDFTEGDAASLQREEDADFETDMGAS